MWRQTYNDEFSTEEEMTSSARKPEPSSETGAETEEELSLANDSTVTLSDRPQAVSDDVLGVVDYQDDILHLAKAREVCVCMYTAVQFVAQQNDSLFSWST